MTNLTDIRSSAISAAGAGLTVYATKEDLPTSGLTSGDQAFVTANSRLYVSNGSGWYNVALINATPSLSIDPTGTIVLSTTGETTTITLTATDSDNAVAGLTYTVESDGSFGGLATLSQDSSVFTITPLSEDSATTSSATLTFKASDGISFGSATRTLTLSFKIQNSKYTAFLLAADSASLDNPILDVSSNELTISKGGNVLTTSFSPYHPGGYSTYFDGSGDYLTVTTDTSLQFGTGDFTIEGWIYLLSRSNTRNGIFSNYSSYSAGSLGMFAGHSSGTTTAYQVAYNGAAFPASVLQGGTIVYGQWVHFAVVRNSGTMDLYIDGTSVDSITATASLDGVGSNFVIGSPGDNLGSSMHGYLRDFRVVKGTAVYTSNFTPQNTSLSAIANTSLLTCHLPYIADGSTNDHALTITGNTQTARIGPYDYQAYTKVDHGGSVYFDGSGDYLTGASSNGLIASGYGFTIEGWVYWTNLRSANEFVVAATTGTNNYEPYWYLGSSTSNNWRFSWGAASTTNSSIPIIKNQWNHFAMVVTSAGAGTLYINGKSEVTTTGITLNGSATGVAISHVGGGPAVNTLNITGYVADVRYVNNSSVYTAEFTPPTAPLTAISGTQFLTGKNQGTIYDKAGSKVDVIVDYGQPSNPAITSSSAQRKFTTSNSIVLANNAEGIDVTGIEIGTGPFTVEGWFYHTLSGQAAIYFSSQTDNTFQIKSDYIDSNRWFYTYVASTGYNFQYTSGDTMLNTWNHIVLQRNSSNVLQMFLNGTSLGTHSSVTGNVNTSNDLQLFAGAEGGGYTNFEGYVQDFRISVGVARYSGNFTPPTAQFEG